MRVSLKAVPGVDTVDVSLEKGLAAVKMKPGKEFKDILDKAESGQLTGCTASKQWVLDLSRSLAVCSSRATFNLRGILNRSKSVDGARLFWRRMDLSGRVWQ